MIAALILWLLRLVQELCWPFSSAKLRPAQPIPIREQRKFVNRWLFPFQNLRSAVWSCQAAICAREDLFKPWHHSYITLKTGTLIMSFFAQVSDRWYCSHPCSCRFDAVEITTVFRRQGKKRWLQHACLCSVASDDMRTCKSMPWHFDPRENHCGSKAIFFYYLHDLRIFAELWSSASYHVGHEIRDDPR